MSLFACLFARFVPVFYLAMDLCICNNTQHATTPPANLIQFIDCPVTTQSKGLHTWDCQPYTCTFIYYHLLMLSFSFVEMFMYMCVYTYMRIYICICVCVHIYVYIYIYIHTYMYTKTHTQAACPEADRGTAGWTGYCKGAAREIVHQQNWRYLQNEWHF